MTHIEQLQPLSRITAEIIHTWFGAEEGFPQVDQIAQYTGYRFALKEERE